MLQVSSCRSLTAVLVLVIGLAGCAPKGDALYTRAEQSLAKGNVQAAVIDLKNLLQDEPQNAQARALLGRALVASGDVNAAAIELQKAKDLGAPRSLTLVADCQVLVARGEFDKVLVECQPEPADAADEADLQLALGGALLGLRRDRDARDQFQAVLAARPDSLDALLGLAEATATVEGMPAARAIVDEAPASARERTQYWMVVGGMSAGEGDLTGAEQAYTRAVELARKGPEAAARLVPLGALAEVQLRLGKVKEAVTTSDEMMKIAPDHPLVKQLRGQVALADGRLDDARTLLEEAVAAMPDNQKTRLLLGLVNLQQGNLGQAEMHFANVLAKQPDDVRAQRLLDETRARLGPQQTALEALNPAGGQDAAAPALLAMNGQMSTALLVQTAASSDNSGTLEVDLAIASGQLIVGDLGGAIESLERAQSGGSSDLRPEFLAMIELLRMGEREKALAQADALLQRSGGDVAVHNMVGGIYAAGGRRDASREQFNEALKLAPNDAYTRLNLARLDLATGNAADAEKTFRSIAEAEPKNLPATLGVAVAAGAQGNMPEAEKWLQKARADHPESVEVQLVLARLYLDSGELAKARAAIDDASRQAPDDAAVSNARGQVLLAAKDLPGALASFQKAATQAPKAYGYALNLARTHILNRDVDAALDVLNGVLKAEPKHVATLALAGAASLQAGQLEKATGYVERLRQAAPEASITHWLEGDLAMNQKRYGEALQHYRNAAAGGSNAALVVAQYQAGSRAGVAQPHQVLEEWLTTHPLDVGVMTVLADDRQRRGDVGGAITLYERALTALSENVVLLNNLAVLYHDKGDPRAVEMAAKAHALAPTSPAVQDTYGWILVETGSLDKGLELLREAIRRVPDNGEIQYHYAAALARKGNTAEAVEVLKKALRGQLPPGVKVDAQELLQQLSK